MRGVTTHILDLAGGKPATGVVVQLFRINDGSELLKTVETNSDGRVDAPLLSAEDAVPGTYELLFHVGDYFEDTFYGEIPIRFKLTKPNEHYHVPLLISPWGYQTYRGS